MLEKAACRATLTLFDSTKACSSKWSPCLVIWFTAIAFDPPGCGLSIPPARDWSDPEVLLQDARVGVMLMHQLGHLPFSCVGWSEGAQSALLAASELNFDVDLSLVSPMKESRNCMDRNSYFLESFKRVKNLNSNIQTRFKASSSGVWRKTLLQRIYLRPLVVLPEAPLIWNPGQTADVSRYRLSMAINTYEIAGRPTLKRKRSIGCALQTSTPFRGVSAKCHYSTLGLS
ncbi:unnamed protein product [Dibothriocephalus latus]|uniref:AB hydrolase-1 domain-containing protein n=1 Tax=Dibothriocephalus latus TaxID=60516 RepID=A0A3P7LFK9_DIBLA|nr:unnamed protein product [Dibothriocephalus latus]